MSKKIAVFLADGFEEIEGLTVVDMCRRAGIEVTTVSIKDTLDIMSSHQIPLKADRLFENVNFDEMDMLVLPGGGLGTENLEKCDKLKEVLIKAAGEGKNLAAICAAPRVLGQLGLLKGRKACCYPGNEEKLLGAEVIMDKGAVKDGPFVTGRGMGTSVEFAAAIIEQVLGKEKSEEILRQIQYIF
ncbi:MAG: DJ-1/PfpI family protein [Lachnospiraceae bacterium]|nr:DJ-1/PfpI family protein [Lachnospiraceae bacterium]